MTVKFAEILLPTALDSGFTYSYQNHLEIGNIVLVEFGKRKIWGIVTKINIPKPENINLEKIKEILEVDKELKIKPNYINFIEKIADYNMVSRGLVTRSFIGILNSDKTKKSNPPFCQEVNFKNFKLKQLNTQQLEIANNIWQNIQKNPCQNFLIEGVTGSGKTEIYFYNIAKTLKENQDSQILILLPEIALTSQIINRFEQQFGFKAAVWHSKITNKNKKAIFNGLNSGSLRVLIGARSALLLPFKNLKMIVIDEEHDPSYKQEDIFKFNARDMAIMLAQIEKIPTILTTATPSIETYNNALNNKYHHFQLTKSYGSSHNIELVDLKLQKLQKDNFISPKLADKIAENLTNKKQTLLFLNRRGYSPVTICKNCGQKYQCLNCDSHLVLHKSKNLLTCHYCSYQEKASNNCKFCNQENSLISLGIGVEKLLEEVNKKFPNARTTLATSDTINSFDKADKLVQDIMQNKIDIIIGTQMISKGYDFPNLTLVGIVDVDSMLYSSELRSLERIFQILNQVIGRSGRRNEQGNIIIQTHDPDNLIFNFLQDGNSRDFYDFELTNRKMFNLFPFCKMAKIEISAFENIEAKKFATNLMQIFPNNNKIEIFGPSKSAIGRIKNRFYYIINIKSDKKVNLQKLIKDVIKNCNIPNKIRISVDIDPI